MCSFNDKCEQAVKELVKTLESKQASSELIKEQARGVLLEVEENCQKGRHYPFILALSRTGQLNM